MMISFKVCFMCGRFLPHLQVRGDLCGKSSPWHYFRFTGRQLCSLIEAAEFLRRVHIDVFLKKLHFLFIAHLLELLGDKVTSFDVLRLLLCCHMELHLHSGRLSVP